MKRLELAELFFKKAAEDEAVVWLVMGNESISDEVFGFHAEQATEKLLKAVLSVQGVTFRRTHDVGLLMRQLAEAGFGVPEEAAGLAALTSFGAVYRYEDFEGPEGLDRGLIGKQLTVLKGWAGARLEAARQELRKAEGDERD